MTRFRMSLLKQNAVVFVVFVLEKTLVRTSRQYSFIGTWFFQLLHDFSNRSLLIFPNLKSSWLKGDFLRMNINIKTTSISWTFTQCLKITEKVSLLIASEASYVYILSSLKMLKMVYLVSFWKPEGCGQTVLPDRSLLIGQKIVKNAKTEKFKYDILRNFLTLCTILLVWIFVPKKLSQLIFKIYFQFIIVLNNNIIQK